MLHCHMMFQMSVSHLNGSSPFPTSHNLSQAGGVAFLVYVNLSKHEMCGGGTPLWIQLVTLVTHRREFRVTGGDVVCDILPTRDQRLSKFFWQCFAS